MKASMNKRTKVLLNSEGNKNIGMGAFYDCAAIAKKFKEKLVPEIKFLISHDSKEDVDSTILNGYDVEKIDMTDTEIFLNSVMEFRPDIIVQNLLNLKESYMDGLKKLDVTIVNVSHKTDFRDHAKADIVINLLYDSKNIMCLHGPKYAILDDRFGSFHKKKIKDIARSFLISFGGSDVNNLSVKLMNLLDKLELDFCANIVVGPGFGEEDLLEKNFCRLSNKHKFKINRHIGDMSDLIYGSDLAFISGGRTMCELAAAGTPGIAFAQNELEYSRLTEFEKWGSVLNYGYFNEDDKGLFSKIKSVIPDQSMREAMSRKGQELIDGKGVDRIIDVIIEYHRKRLIAGA